MRGFLYRRISRTKYDLYDSDSSADEESQPVQYLNKDCGTHTTDFAKHPSKKLRDMETELANTASDERPAEQLVARLIKLEDSLRQIKAGELRETSDQVSELGNPVECLKVALAALKNEVMQVTGQLPERSSILKRLSMLDSAAAQMSDANGGSPTRAPHDDLAARMASIEGALRELCAVQALYLPQQSQILQQLAGRPGAGAATGPGVLQSKPGAASPTPGSYRGTLVSNKMAPLGTKPSPGFGILSSMQSAASGSFTPNTPPGTSITRPSNVPRGLLFGAQPSQASLLKRLSGSTDGGPAGVPGDISSPEPTGLEVGRVVSATAYDGGASDATSVSSRLRNLDLHVHNHEQALDDIKLQMHKMETDRRMQLAALTEAHDKQRTGLDRTTARVDALERAAASQAVGAAVERLQQHMHYVEAEVVQPMQRRLADMHAAVAVLQQQQQQSAAAERSPGSIPDPEAAPRPDSATLLGPANPLWEQRAAGPENPLWELVEKLMERVQSLEASLVRQQLSPEPVAAAAGEDERLQQLQEQMARMQAQMEELTAARAAPPAAAEPLLAAAADAQGELGEGRPVQPTSPTTMSELETLVSLALENQQRLQQQLEGMQQRSQAGARLEQIQALEGSLEQVNTRLQLLASSEMTSSLQAKVDELQAAWSSMHDQISLCQQASSEQQQVLAGLHAMAQTSSEQILSLQEEAQATPVRLAELTSALQGTDGRLDELEATLHQLTSQQRSRGEEVEAQLAAEAGRINVLQDHLETLAQAQRSAHSSITAVSERVDVVESQLPTFVRGEELQSIVAVQVQLKDILDGLQDGVNNLMHEAEDASKAQEASAAKILALEAGARVAAGSVAELADQLDAVNKGVDASMEALKAQLGAELARQLEQSAQALAGLDSRISASLTTCATLAQYEDLQGALRSLAEVVQHVESQLHEQLGSQGQELEARIGDVQQQASQTVAELSQSIKAARDGLAAKVEQVEVEAAEQQAATARQLAACVTRQHLARLFSPAVFQQLESLMTAEATGEPAAGDQAHALLLPQADEMLGRLQAVVEECLGNQEVAAADLLSLREQLAGMQADLLRMHDSLPEVHQEASQQEVGRLTLEVADMRETVQLLGQAVSTSERAPTADPGSQAPVTRHEELASALELLHAQVAQLASQVSQLQDRAGEPGSATLEAASSPATTAQLSELADTLRGHEELASALELLHTQVARLALDVTELQAHMPATTLGSEVLEALQSQMADLQAQMYELRGGDDSDDVTAVVALEPTPTVSNLISKFELAGLAEKVAALEAAVSAKARPASQASYQVTLEDVLGEVGLAKEGLSMLSIKVDALEAAAAHPAAAASPAVPLAATAGPELGTEGSIAHDQLSAIQERLAFHDEKLEEIDMRSDVNRSQITNLRNGLANALSELQALTQKVQATQEAAAAPASTAAAAPATNDWSNSNGSMNGSPRTRAFDLENEVLACSAKVVTVEGQVSSTSSALLALATRVAAMEAAAGAGLPQPAEPLVLQIRVGESGEPAGQAAAESEIASQLLERICKLESAIANPLEPQPAFSNGDAASTPGATARELAAIRTDVEVLSAIVAEHEAKLVAARVEELPDTISGKVAWLEGQLQEHAEALQALRAKAAEAQAATSVGDGEGDGSALRHLQSDLMQLESRFTMYDDHTAAIAGALDRVRELQQQVEDTKGRMAGMQSTLPVLAGSLKALEAEVAEKLSVTNQSLDMLSNALMAVAKIEKPKQNNPFANLGPGASIAVQVLEQKMEQMRVGLYSSVMLLLESIKSTEGAKVDQANAELSRIASESHRSRPSFTQPQDDAMKRVEERIAAAQEELQGKVRSICSEVAGALEQRLVKHDEQLAALQRQVDSVLNIML